MNGKKRSGNFVFILFCVAVLLVLAVSFSLFFIGRFGTAVEIILADIVLLIVFAIVIILHFLRKSMKKTIYSYKNIALFGSVIFLFVFLIVFSLFFFDVIDETDLSLKHIFQMIINFPKTFSFYAVFFMIAVCLLLGISNVSLMIHEGFRPKNALSLFMAVFYIGGTFAIYFISDLLNDKVFIPRGMYLDPLFNVLSTVIPLFLLLLLCYFECIFIGSAIMGYIAARQKPHYDRDFIIILGCSIDKKGGLLPLLKGRVNRAIRFAWDQEIESGKPLKYVPSGGKGSNEIMSEGSAMELYLKTRGAEDGEVFPEKKSASTWENMCFSKKIIDEMKPDAKIAFATTNYHMLRSGILAQKAGMNAEGIAGDTKWYFWPNGFIREFIAILSMSIRSHVTFAVISAFICTFIGILGYFANLI